MESFVVGETLKYLYLLFDTKDEIFLHNSTIMQNKIGFSPLKHIHYG